MSPSLPISLFAPSGYIDENLHSLASQIDAIMAHTFVIDGRAGAELGPVTVKWDGDATWEARSTNSFHAGQHVGPTFTATASDGVMLNAQDSQVTSWGSSGVSGHARHVRIQLPGSVPGDARRWAILGVKDAKGPLQCAFPMWVRDTGNSKAWAGACVAGVNGHDVPVLLSETGDRLFFRFDDHRLTDDEIVDLVHTAGWVLAFTLGVAITGEVQVVRTSDAEHVDSLEWYPCRPVERSRQPCLPSVWSAWAVAQKMSGSQLSALPADRWMAAVDAVIKRRPLAGMMETLSAASDAPLGMRGPLAAIALEVMAKQVGHAPPPPLDDQVWSKLRKKFLEVIQNCDAPQIAKNMLEGKISSINEPSNNAKLIAPFEHLGIALSDEERTAIRDRNRYLHGRGGEAIDDWREMYRDETAMVAVASRLLLHMLGLGGLTIMNQVTIARDQTAGSGPFMYRLEHFRIA